jgi:hypothetical protein
MNWHFASRSGEGTESNPKRTASTRLSVQNRFVNLTSGTERNLPTKIGKAESPT